MNVTVLGAAGHLPLPADSRLSVVRADAISGQGVPDAVEGADTVLSVLGIAYQRQPITAYSRGTRNAVTAMRDHARSRRLVVTSWGLTYAPPSVNLLADHPLLPLLRKVLGRTLYADMRAMEEYPHTTSDIEWTVMRPVRLIDADRVTHYRLDYDHPSHGYTSRSGLTAAMVAELAGIDHVHQAVAPTTNRREGAR